ncbi:Spy/CpxP family protein refolding chaperone [Candidatus Latescibacterota bacterium]
MKRTLVISFVFVFATVTSLVFAQSTQEHSHEAGSPPSQEQGMMMHRQGGMMDQGGGRMMNHGGMMRGGGSMSGNNQFYLNRRDELGLTEEQVNNLQRIRLDHVEQTSEIQAELLVARTELQDLLEDEDTRIGTLEEKIRDIHNLEADLQIEQIRNRIEARNVLTPEQREQAGTRRQGDLHENRQPGGAHMEHGGDMMHDDNTMLHNQVH